MTPDLFIRHTLRESRGGLSRLAFSIACLAIGVSAVVAIAALSSSFEKGFRDNAKEMLGADIAIRSSEPFPDGWDAIFETIDGAEWMMTREQPQSVRPADGPKTIIADLMVVGQSYPYYGDLALRGATSVEAALSSERIIIARDLFSELNIEVGDRLQIGDASFEVAAWAGRDPDRITGFMYIGPRVYMSEDAFARANVSGVRIGVRYKALVRLPDMAPAELEALKDQIETSLESTMGRARVETYIEGRPSLQDGLDRLSRFLGLIALLSLLLGGVGVAQAVRAWIAGRMDAIAVLKCLGMRPREIFVLYGAQALMLGLVGSVIGAALGLSVTALLPIAFAEFVPRNLVNPWQPRAALGGIALGVAVAAVFGLPPLLAVLRVPPIRVFRRDAEPLPAAKWAAALTAVIMVCGISALAGLQARSALVGTIFAFGVILTGALLALSAWALVKLVTLIPRGWSGRVWLRHGLAAVARPGANTVPSIVALGLGLNVLFCAALVQEFLNQALTGSLPERIPSAVVINIRPEQAEALADTLTAAGAQDIESSPLVMAKLVAIDGTPIEEIINDDGSGMGRRRRRLRSEQTLTYGAELSAGQKVIEGEWWHKPDVAELSVERRQAERFDLDVGSQLTFSMAGEQIELEVTSLREVDWEEVSLNFEWVVEPGYLEELPQFRVATMWLPDGTGRATQSKVISAFPNVTFLPLSDVAERVIAQLDKISWGIRLLGLFIVAASMAVLAGTVGIDSNRRGREVALLKTVGMTRREVAGVFIAEYALIGLVAGLIGVTGGGVIAALVLTQALEAEFHWPFGLFALAVIGGIAITVAAGLAASFGALQRCPIEMLRYQE